MINQTTTIRSNQFRCKTPKMSLVKYCISGLIKQEACREKECNEVRCSAGTYIFAPNRKQSSRTNTGMKQKDIWRSGGKRSLSPSPRDGNTLLERLDSPKIFLDNRAPSSFFLFVSVLFARCSGAWTDDYKF